VVDGRGLLNLDPKRVTWVRIPPPPLVTLAQGWFRNAQANFVLCKTNPTASAESNSADGYCMVSVARSDVLGQSLLQKLSTKEYN
jgi:hypothetical protein